MTLNIRKTILTFSLLMGLSALTPTTVEAVGLGNDLNIYESTYGYNFIIYDEEEKEAIKQQETVTDVDEVVNIYDRLLDLLKINKEEQKNALIEYKKSQEVVKEIDVKKETIEAVIKTCLAQLGKDYVWGAEGPNTFDCSGLMQWSFAKHGYVLPRVAADQARTGEKLEFEELERGDMVFFHTDKKDPDRISHVGLYLGSGFFVHAPQTGDVVKISYMGAGKYYTKFAWGIRTIK